MAVDRESAERLLKDKGLKVTRQRMAVLEAIAACPKEHLTAEEIFELVKVDCPDIGLATVYRTIQLLGSLHLIDRINFDDGFVRYEMGSALEGTGRHRHHHLICIKCGTQKSESWYGAVRRKPRWGKYPEVGKLVWRC
ncbi:MAG: transcriptional repressor [Lachnospiraceae bacterium]|nr:transcriptional repressor [Lachnospiraceae bacterium]